MPARPLPLYLAVAEQLRGAASASTPDLADLLRGAAALLAEIGSQSPAKLRRLALAEGSASVCVLDVIVPPTKGEVAERVEAAFDTLIADQPAPKPAPLTEERVREFVRELGELRREIAAILGGAPGER